MYKWFSAICCCLVLGVNAQQTQEPDSVQLEKAYQQVLYEYYQGNFSSALTQMAILEQKFPLGLSQIPDTLRDYQVEPELLKGGISLAYGLEDQATDIFLRLLADNAKPDVIAFSWLLLGKTYYQKRQFLAAAQAFQKINQDDAETFFEPSIRDNWLYMQSQLQGFLLKDDGHIHQTQWLEQLSSNSIYRQYVQYNQALALLQQGDKQQAISQLSGLANNDSGFVHRWMGWAQPLFAGNEELDIKAERDAIRDRANLTLGYALLQHDQAHDAFKVFENIRTEGLDAEAALLGYGWAAANKDELQSALSIWQSLIKMPQNSEFVLESYLASAYAYEKAFAPRQALQLLQQGITRFEQTLVDLKQAEQQVNQRQFILSLLSDVQSIQPELTGSSLILDAKGRQLKVMQLFNSVEVSSEFRAGLSALEETSRVQRKLQNWRQRMQHYSLMLDERQAERIARAKLILSNRTLEQLPVLKVKRDQLAQIIETANTTTDGQVFMGEQSQKWLNRLRRSEKRLATIAQLKEQLGQAPLSVKYQERLARVSGRLIWQASEAYAGNKWRAQKSLNQLDSDISQAQERQQQLLDQLAAKPDFSAQRLKVQNLAQRIDSETEKTKLLQTALVSQLSEMFTQSIHGHGQKVRNYILQAQLAMVRLNDQALQKDDGKSSQFDAGPATEGESL